jgi:hypothetical protein
VRSRGYMLEQADPPGGVVPVLGAAGRDEPNLDDDDELDVRAPAS